jgi:cytochrome b
MQAEAPLRRVRIWDLPIRIFHWLIVLLIPFQWWTAKEDRLDLHMIGGSLVVALLVFRWLWGLFGSSTARFTRFIKGPRAIISYLRGRAPHVVGHNPLGALSVVGLLGLLTVHVGLGLFAGDEDGIESGPLAYLIDEDVAEDMADLHKDSFDILLVLIGLHIAAILFYALFRRKNLIGPMISGSGEAPADVGEMEKVPAWRFVIAATAAAVVAWWIQSGAIL